MEIYLQKPSLGTGPHLLYKVREMLADGRLTPEDIAWHEGQETWQPIGQMESLMHLLPESVQAELKSSSASEPPPLPEKEDSAGGGEGEKSIEELREMANRITELAKVQRTDVMRRHSWAWRRFWARTFDLGLWFTLVWLGAWKAGVVEFGEFALPSQGLLMGAIATWIFAESLQINTFGTTPGKMLMGLRIISDEMEVRPEETEFSTSPPVFLDMPQALKRSVGVWFFGVGAGLGLVRVLCEFFSLRRFLITSSSLWDDWAASRVQAKSITTMRVMAFILLSIGWLMLRGQVLLSHPPSNLPAEMKTLIDELKAKLPASPETVTAALAP